MGFCRPYNVGSRGIFGFFVGFERVEMGFCWLMWLVCQFSFDFSKSQLLYLIVSKIPMLHSKIIVF